MISDEMERSPLPVLRQLAEESFGLRRAFFIALKGQNINNPGQTTKECNPGNEKQQVSRPREMLNMEKSKFRTKWNKR